MYQAYAQELLNQKESKSADSDDYLMSQTQDHPLFAATRRLLGALDRLEHNLTHVTVAHDRDVHQEQQLVVFERENAALKQERESLNNAIAQLQYQYDDLHKVASTIHGKLDDSIKRLTQIIED
jgi:hypothetical protein